MKTIGLLGGMSWESTLLYYKALNEGVKAALGGLHSARICLVSVDFHDIETYQRQNDWQAAAGVLSGAARKIEAGGADFLLICTNTMHKVADEIQAAIRIPIVHIADATAEKLIADGVGTVGLLGTAFTMEQDFYKGRLTGNYGLKVLTPPAQDRALVHSVIFNELCLGTVKDASKAEFRRIIAGLQTQGAQAVILGCTEIGMLISQQDSRVTLYDTTDIHARKAVAYALQ
jgi:aspartate racemase